MRRLVDSRSQEDAPGTKTRSNGRKMKITLIIAFVFAIVQGGESGSVADEGECTVDDDCLNVGKGRKCVKPFPDCGKGYCQCPFGDFGYDKDGEICKTSDATKDAACGSGKNTCNVGAGLECTSSTCSCKATTVWATADLSCSDTSGSNKGKKLGVDCGADGICVAKSGVVKACEDGSQCSCADTYKADGSGGCTKRISYLKDDACKGLEAAAGSVATGMLCSTSMVAYTNGGSPAVTTATSFECSSDKCVCPSAKPIFVKLGDKLSFCKVNTGTKNLGEVCTSDAQCSSTFACGKCPGDSEKKCQNDVQSSGSDVAARHITLAAVFVILGVAQLVKH